MSSETILQSWFKNSIQPSQTMLWVSAVAPDTFQGDPYILEKLLKRPLEIPDAMGQQRARARYISCLLARAITALNPSPMQIAAFLHEFHYFQNPDTLVHKPLPDKLLSQIKNLIRDEFDPTAYWQYELRTLTQHFQEGLHILRTLFKTRLSKKETPQLNSFFVNEHEWWGTNYYNEANLVNIHPPFLFLPAVSKNLVLRDAVRVFLPRSFRSAMDVQEFSNIMVSELLNPTDQQLWSTIKWNGSQPTPEHQEWISTIASLTPKLIEKNRLTTLYKRLSKIDTRVSQVPTGSFTILTQLELSEKLPSPSLTKVQQTILLHLARNPLASERQLAKTTQLARGTVNRNLLAFQQQLGLLVPGEMNYHKIGLTPLLLRTHSLLSTKEELSKLSDLRDELEAFPYCIRLHAPSYQTQTIIHAIISLPESALIHFCQYMELWKQESGVASELYRINRFEWGWEFDSWKEFLPTEWKIMASSHLRSEKSETSLHTSLDYTEPRIKLTREALRILLILQHDMRISQRQLATRAETSVTTAANHYNKLIPHVITPFFTYANPPLPEGFITAVHSSSIESLRQFLDGIRLLPAYQAWHLSSLDSEESASVLLNINLPQGGLIPFLTVFPEVTSYYDLIPTLPVLTSRSLPQIHGLPLALFKTVGQEWMCSTSLLESLFRLQS
ncbi:MAG: winged helix-turn-helix domain-containing protein [Promethearchaeota archaeon]